MRPVSVVFALLAVGLLTCVASSTSCRRKSTTENRQQKPASTTETDGKQDPSPTSVAPGSTESRVDGESTAPATSSNSSPAAAVSQSAWYEQPRIQRVSSSLLADATDLTMGIDPLGNLWLAVVDQTQGTPMPVRLVEFQVEQDQWFDRGQVPEAAQTAAAHGVYQAADKAIYFATLENADDAHGLTGNSYLWRFRPSEHSWQPMLKTERPLRSVCQSGQFVFALGDQHTVYQVDSSSAVISDTTIGSVDQHVSQQLIVDRRGHLFVPRVKQGLDGGNAADRTANQSRRFLAELVELDTQRKVIQALPLDYYGPPSDGEAVGIVAVVHQADDSIVFATDQGYLYRLIPVSGVPTIVQKIGWLHPSGISQPAGLASSGAAHIVAGLAKTRQDNSVRFDWVVYDWNGRQASIYPMEDPRNLLQLNDLVLHSCQESADGGCYLAGSYRQGNRRQAILLKVHSAAD